MLGLFGALDLGSRSLQVQQQGVEVAGHNLANVNNPAYARQRLAIGAAPSIDTATGPQGTGVAVIGIERLRSSILDSQIQDEASVQGSLQAQQDALQYAEANLGQQIDRSASADPLTAAQGGQVGLAGSLTALFSKFQSLSTDPSSMTERQALLSQASTLATQFNQVDQRLGSLQGQLNGTLADDTGKANDLLQQIAALNTQITRSEQNSGGEANDLRDSRQDKLEQLAQLVKVDAVEGNDGALNISIAGTSFVEGGKTVETLEDYDGGGGQMMVRAQTSGLGLNLTGGSLHGTIEARDGAVADLRKGINTLASQLITEVNAAHRDGFSLTGTTGADFFTGTGAGDIQVNSALKDNAALIQAAGVSDAAGDGAVAKAMGQLADKQISILGGSTLSQNYAQTVTGFGQSQSAVDQQLTDQSAVTGMLSQQRESVSGVSMDEEMTNLVKFQKAYAASAKLITTIDDMLNTVINLKQ
ncbi:MAG TPA: flagellar hook-associated protein FlgK [Candidatus Limnocylindria bacterium]|jgi:flagellar hook-associated protein 1 FlgK|nr:flagellar hook-associated protein FlgK [Candidatus Limnocylindria bacterium]